MPSARFIYFWIADEEVYRVPLVAVTPLAITAAGLVRQRKGSSAIT